MPPVDDDDPSEGSPRVGAVERVVRVVLPLAVLSLVLAVFVGEQTTLSHELHLVAPERARPGDPVPLRTLLFGDLEALSGPQVVSGSVTVALRDEGDATLAVAQLTPSPSGGQEGTLVVPATAAGTYTLHAVSSLDGEAVASVDRPILIDAASASAASLGRPTTELQALRPGPIEVVAPDRAPPSILEVRIAGAACVPETPCQLLVRVGTPPASVRLADGAASSETDGVVTLEHTVHGPEAEVVLEALRGGELVARRRVRLPVALATPGLAITDDGRLRVDVLGDPPAVIVDAYTDGRWVRTGSIAPTDQPFALPFAPLEPGVHRVQVRTDPFSSERAATRLIRVGEPPDAEVLDALRRVATDEAALPGDLTQRPAGPWFEWVASPLEASVQITPRPTSGHDADLARIEGRQRTLRWAALAGMGLGILVLVLYFLRRGVEAAMLAQGVMDATEDPVLSSSHHRRRTLLSALAIVATLLLALVGAAALIVVRGHLFT